MSTGDNAKDVPLPQIEDVGEEGSRISHMRKFEGPMKIIVSIIAVSLGLFHLYTGVFGSLFIMYQRCIHIGLISVLVFMLYPCSRRMKGIPAGVIDSLFIIVSIAVFVFPIIDMEGMARRMGDPNMADLIFGGLAIIVILEASRRVIGLPLVIVACISILYALYGNIIPGILGHRQFSLLRFLSNEYTTTEGIFGIPLGVSSTFVILFILFGGFLMSCGMGAYFTDLALAVSGGSPGGPAKVAVVASGFDGMISGSSVANVVTTGSVTIPLMIKIGYPRHFAGAVEATASTGGQFMPPVMGAGAFVMSELLAIPYLTIALYAFIPACLYYFACYMQIHYRAVKMGMVGLPKKELPDFWPTFKAKLYLFLPIVVLMVFLFLNYSPMRVGTMAIGATILVGIFQKGSRRITIHSFFKTMEDGVKTAIGVAVACTCAGIIVGVITMTGLGLKISIVIIDLSQGNLFITLALTAIVCLIMGMGVPVTASYIIVATIGAPALIKLGVLPLAAHLFVFYFAVLADITPPVCIAAYAAAGLAGADPMRTGFTATKLGIAAFIVPFIFCYAPSLMGLGTPSEVIQSMITACIGVIALAAGAEWFLLRKNKFYESIILFVAAFCLIKPGTITDIIGIVLFAFVVALQYFTTP
ncbi:MAG: TRAP transporter permease, partial [Deltaproteobacteria bacterium]|nr:TRAP transporter permease [Deltaproteobacteria bacterium]